MTCTLHWSQQTPSVLKGYGLFPYSDLVLLHIQQTISGISKLYLKPFREP
jgi:hypothetical protein